LPRPFAVSRVTIDGHFPRSVTHRRVG